MLLVTYCAAELKVFTKCVDKGEEEKSDEMEREVLSLYP